MATYIIENLKGFFRMMIIEAETEEVAISKSTLQTNSHSFFSI